MGQREYGVTDKRRQVDKADVQCPIPTVRSRVWGHVGHRSGQDEIFYIPKEYFRCDWYIARRFNIVRDHVKGECTKFNKLFVVLRLFFVSGFAWSNLCLQNHKDCAWTRSLRLRYGRTTNLNQRLIFSVSVSWTDYFITLLPAVCDLRKSEESGKEQWQELL